MYNSHRGSAGNMSVCLRVTIYDFVKRRTPQRGGGGGVVVVYHSSVSYRCSHTNVSTVMGTRYEMSFIGP